MIRVAWVRGAYLNRFEGQNYEHIDGVALTGFSSQYPLDPAVSFPLTKLWSLTDLAHFSSNSTLITKGISYIANRTLGDAQCLIGLEKHLSYYDIVHTADPHYYYSYQIAKLRKAGKIKRMIVTSWETMPFNNESVTKKRNLKHYVLETADAFMCYTTRAKQALIAEGVDEKLIELIPLGVDQTVFYPPESREGPLTYLFSGRLVKEKGVLDLYDAFVKLSKVKDVKLIIAGNGVLKKTLLESIKRDHLEDNVTIISASYKEMSEIYRQADVFILPSLKTSTWEEQYGMVLAEAASTGLAVIAADTGAIGEVAGPFAKLYNPDNPDELYNALNEFTDPTKREEFSARSLWYARNIFDSRKTSEQIGTIYRRILS